MITNFVSLSDACDPSWRNTHDGLITSASSAFIVAYIFAASAVWVHVYYHFSKF